MWQDMHSAGSQTLIPPETNQTADTRAFYKVYFYVKKKKENHMNVNYIKFLLPTHN